MACGIYLIRCKDTNKNYVGQSINIARRIQAHKCQLRNNTHANEYLQAAWNKYLEESFEFLTLELVEPEFLTAREIFYIKNYQSSLRQHGYNLSFPDATKEHFRHTEEAKRKVSEKKKGTIVSDATKAKLSKAVKVCGYKHSKETLALISAANRGKRLSEWHINRIKQSKLGIARTEEVKKAISKSKDKYKTSGVLISPTGERVEVFGLRAFCKEKGLDHTHIGRVLSGKAKTHKGWRKA